MASRNFTSSVLVMLTMLCTDLFAQTNFHDPEINRPSPDVVNNEWKGPLTQRDGEGHVPTKETKGAPMPYQPIRQDDIMWKKRVWREISTLEKANIAFRYAGDEHTGGGMLIEILMHAIKTGKIPAYANTDDRFTTLLTREQLEEQTQGRSETVRIIDPITDSETTVITYKEFNPETVTKYRLIEDWMFDRNTGQMAIRIVGIAPVRDIYGANGDYRGSQCMFWVHYAEARNLLAGYQAVNAANDAQRESWVDYLEARRFSSRITKVSNPYGSVAGSYGESFKERGLSPTEALYAGKHAAAELANVEHDVWQY